MEGCVALILEIGVGQVGWIVLENALDQAEIVRSNGAPKTCWNVNPGPA